MLHQQTKQQQQKENLFGIMSQLKCNNSMPTQGHCYQTNYRQNISVKAYLQGDIHCYRIFLYKKLVVRYYSISAELDLKLNYFIKMFTNLFVFTALLAFAYAGILTPVTYLQKETYPQVDAVASTHESVVRSFDGTVSHHSKAVDTPYSSVRKSDTRINNNVYTPALAKTVTYAAPVAKTFSYAHPAVSYAAPVHNTLYSSGPAVRTYSVTAPATHAVYTNAAPAVFSHVQPVAVKSAITYSPAAAVAHVTFDGIGAHWAY